jgi:DNA polymerase-3 subunit epsilon
MKTLYIDFETTGLQSWKHGIVQVAAIMDLDGQEVDVFESRVKPDKSCQIEDQALAVSGVTREQLETFPDEYDVLVQFRAFLDKHKGKTGKLVFAGYNSPFDMDFARAWFSRHFDDTFRDRFYNPDMDVMRLAFHRLAPERHKMVNFRLGTVARRVLGDADFEYWTGGKDLHDAMVDIRLTRALHLALKDL